MTIATNLDVHQVGGPLLEPAADLYQVEHALVFFGAPHIPEVERLLCQLDGALRESGAAELSAPFELWERPFGKLVGLPAAFGRAAHASRRSRKP